MADVLVPLSPSLPPHLTSWMPGQSLVSTWPAAFTAILSYLALVFGLRELMKYRPAFKLSTPFRMHNAFLSLSSLLLLALIIEEVAKVWYNVGPYDTFCAKASWTRVKSRST